MSRALAADLRRLTIALAAAVLVGWVSGHVAAALAVALLGIVAWHLHEMWRMHRWLSGRGERPASRRGLLAELVARIDRLQRQARKRKKRMRKIADRFQQAAEANPDGAVILDGSGRIEWLNRASVRMLGLRQGQDHGQPVTHLMRQPGFTRWLERDDPSEPHELQSPVTEGQRLLLRHVPYGNAKRMLMVRDITRLHTLEQMRRDFVANVSHELRSPLTVIVGYLERMSDDAQLPAAYRRPIAQMQQQAARMERIVGDLLGLSRIESSPGAAARQPVAMTGLIESVVRDAERISDVRHDVEIEARAELELLAERDEVYSALSNLVFNAVQYTPAGGAIAITWREDPDGTGVLEVRDSGVGIEPHHIPRLTERFYRVDRARSREQGGTGLGLAIVKHVLMRHDATLEIASVPDEGSTFRCRFPADRLRGGTHEAGGDAEVAVAAVQASSR